MPVTIKNTRMKYKDGNGEYVGINAVAEQTTAEMIDDIEDAGADQLEDISAAGASEISAIEARGEEVYASLPPTYTELTEEVDALSGAITLIEDTESDYTTSGSFANLIYETLGLYVDENGDICQKEEE